MSPEVLSAGAGSLATVSAIATGAMMGPGGAGESRGRGRTGPAVFLGERGFVCQVTNRHRWDLQRALSAELSADEVPLAELAVEQLHDEAVAMPSQCRVVARPLVAQEGMLRVELVPLVEDAGLFEAATD